MLACLLVVTLGGASRVLAMDDGGGEPPLYGALKKAKGEMNWVQMEISMVLDPKPLLMALHLDVPAFDDVSVHDAIGAFIKSPQHYLTQGSCGDMASNLYWLLTGKRMEDTHKTTLSGGTLGSQLRNAIRGAATKSAKDGKAMYLFVNDGYHAFLIEVTPNKTARLYQSMMAGLFGGYPLSQHIEDDNVSVSASSWGRALEELYNITAAKSPRRIELQLQFFRASFDWPIHEINIVLFEADGGLEDRLNQAKHDYEHFLETEGNKTLTQWVIDYERSLTPQQVGKKHKEKCILQ